MQEKGRDGGSAAGSDRVFGKLTDRSVNSDIPSPAIGSVAFPDDVDTETLKEFDAFREKMLGFIPRSFGEQAVILDTHLHKVRAHIVADERERRRLQGEILRCSKGPDGERIFTEQMILKIIDATPGWDLAPQRARDAARKIRI